MTLSSCRAQQIIDEFEYGDDVAKGGCGPDDIIVNDPQPVIPKPTRPNPM